MKKKPVLTPEELLRQYTPLVCHIVSASLNNPEDIRECVNEVFFEFYHNSASFDSEKGTYASYLAAIARNRSISFYRRNRHHNQMTAWEAGLDEPLSASGDNIEEQIVSKLDLEAALAKLEPEDLDIIRKKYYDGMTIKEIAASMNLPYETIKKRHQRSLSRLRLLLLVILILAILAGCGYFVAKHMGIIPGYGINTTEATTFYRMSEPVTVEIPQADLTARITSAVYQDGLLLIRYRLYGADDKPYISTLKCWHDGEMNHELSDSSYQARLNLETQTLDASFNNYILAYRVDDYSSHNVYQPEFSDAALSDIFDGSDAVTVSLTCDFLNYHTTYSDTLDEYGFPAEMYSTDEIYASFTAELTLIKMDDEALEAYPHEYAEKNGGIAAIPRLENGELIVELYPLQGEYGYVLPSVTEHIWYNGTADEPEPGSITVTAEDGTVLTGERLGQDASDAVFFSEWNFGPAAPGTYTLNIPYLLKYYYDETQIVVPIDITDCTVENTIHRFDGGSFQITCIEALTWDEVRAGNYPEKFIPEYYFSPPFSDEDLLWKIDIRTSMDAPDETMTNINLYATRSISQNTLLPNQNFVMLIPLDYPEDGMIRNLLYWVGGSLYREEEPYDEMYLTMQGMEYYVTWGTGNGSIVRWDCDLQLELHVEQ